MIGNPDLQAVNQLATLTRPIYGHLAALANRAISEAHSHPWAQLSFALQGVLQIDTETARYLAPPNQAVWIPPGIAHGVSCSRLANIRSLYIRNDAIPLQRQACQVLQVSPLLKELITSFSQLPEEYNEQNAEGRLAAVLLDQLAVAPSTPLLLPWPQDRRLKRLCERLHKQPDLTLTLEAFGNQIGVSSKTLTRLFQTEVGMTFRQWRQRCRVLSALVQLEKGHRVTDVALNCGYTSLSAFIVTFKEQLGKTPKRFFEELTSSPAAGEIQ